MAVAKSGAKRAPTMKFLDVDGKPLSLSRTVTREVTGLDGRTELTNFAVMKKEYRDAVATVVGGSQVKNQIHVTFDVEDPLAGRMLEPGKNNPFCRKCGLDDMGCKSPYIEPFGSSNPDITVVLDAVHFEEDKNGTLTTGGYASQINKMLKAFAENADIPPLKIRWHPITLCHVPKGSKKTDFKRKGNWCKIHLVQDILRHPPKMLMPIGTAVLGNLCHKSNANDWSGKLLTYRGWPDDWLTNPAFMKPRPDPRFPDDPSKWVTGHPLLGPAPEGIRIPMWPLMSLNLVWAAQNPEVVRRWKRHFMEGVDIAVNGAPEMSYTRPWYRSYRDPEQVGEALIELCDLIQRNPGMLLTFDTETTGLKPWQHRVVDTNTVGSKYEEYVPDEDFPPKIVSLMFRWDNPETGEPGSLAFPWDYEGSPLEGWIDDMTPLVLEALYGASLCGHNLAFDILFAYATLKGADINKLTSRKAWDTWHMAFTRRQQPGTLGLEAIAYEHVPDMAGYEEDMALLIELEKELLHPGANKRGHYAKCPLDKWDSHYVPYMIGDVEVAHKAREKLEGLLENSKTYQFPLAHPENRNRFRWFSAPRRDWVYEHIVSPAASMLTAMMGRGMHVSTKELEILESEMPGHVESARKQFRTTIPAVDRWYRQRKEEDGDWELDLENKTDLKIILFDVMKLPIKRLTKSGKKLYGETEEEWEANPDLTPDERLKYASIDKFTLNHLAVDHKELVPLQDYRQKFKIYSTYIRPLRNYRRNTIDKKDREKTSHLMVDDCIHASFLLTGTRGGRLSCREPNLQQLPRRTNVKKMFTSRFGKEGCLYGADLSQIELRIMACVCGDPSMVDAYVTGIDLHTLTASKIFKKSYETFTKENFEKLQGEGKAELAKELNIQRNIGKTVNFLTGYGGGAFGLQNVLAASGIYLSMEECEDIIESFFDAYPALRHYLGLYKSFIEETAVAVSILGRVRIFEEVRSEDTESSSKALRAGCNHLIQSTASDIMLVCLTHIEQEIRKRNLRSLLVSTVHDSLLVDAVRSELDELHDIVYSALNNIPDVLHQRLPGVDTSWMIVPFAGDCEVGNDYYGVMGVGKPGEVDWKRILSS